MPQNLCHCGGAIVFRNHRDATGGLECAYLLSEGEHKGARRPAPARGSSSSSASPAASDDLLPSTSCPCGSSRVVLAESVSIARAKFACQSCGRLFIAFRREISEQAKAAGVPVGAFALDAERAHLRACRKLAAEIKAQKVG